MAQDRGSGSELKKGPLLCSLNRVFLLEEEDDKLTPKGEGSPETQGSIQGSDSRLQPVRPFLCPPHLELSPELGVPWGHVVPRATGTLL